jgi:hypothetical protein
MNQVTRLKRVETWGRSHDRATVYAAEAATPMQRLLVWGLALAFCVVFWVAVGFAAALLLG